MAKYNIPAHRQKLLSVLCFTTVGFMIGILYFQDPTVSVRVTNDTSFGFIANKKVSELLSVNLSCSGEPISNRVISFSLFGDINMLEITQRFYMPFASTLHFIGKFYPGWEVRVYYHPSVQSYVTELENVRLCNVMALPFSKLNITARYMDLSWSNPRTWRFLSLLDADVDIFISRDSDAVILEREVAAVEEWLSLNKTFHIMRDHPQHGAPILAGMWGARLDYRRKDVKSALIDLLLNSQDNDKSTDQRQLELRLWHLAKTDSVIHDSYFCEDFHLSFGALVRPFPLQRVNFTFVGNVFNMTEAVKEECPMSCRPKEHKDWAYC